ncbi:hypothetical protein GCM10011348_11910 [Marinobacterium nitratireducens]|uniref:Uncharacterized protein n=1 Tax=Marinobacterium nitratireducens TaxID=518897 RepID=A0A917ZC09_9GAMM|nr:hypothetical protein GCM10011348_11910 [Marinobacterium nitratireducens]
MAALADGNEFAVDPLDIQQQAVSGQRRHQGRLFQGIAGQGASGKRQSHENAETGACARWARRLYNGLDYISHFHRIFLFEINVGRNLPGTSHLGILATEFWRYSGNTLG